MHVTANVLFWDLKVSKFNAIQFTFRVFLSLSNWFGLTVIFSWWVAFLTHALIVSSFWCELLSWQNSNDLMNIAKWLCFSESSYFQLHSIVMWLPMVRFKDWFMPSLYNHENSWKCIIIISKMHAQVYDQNDHVYIHALSLAINTCICLLAS